MVGGRNSANGISLAFQGCGTNKEQRTKNQEQDMKYKTYLAGLACSSLMIGAGNAAVTMSNVGTTAPSAGDGFANTDSSGARGGVDYSDGGGLGQSFTLPAGFTYEVNSYSLMYFGDNGGGDSFGAGATWNAQIVRYDNVASGGFAERLDTNGTPHSASYLANPFISQVYSDFAGPGAEPTTGDWVTVAFTDGDVLTLNGGFTYGIVLSSDVGWSQWMAAGTDNYAEAEKFRAYGGPNFNDNYVRQSDANERTFVLNLTATPIPEPSIALFGGLGLFGLLRRRRA